jgi:threonine/homoserine/homoserine lactone efflux protein
LFIAAFLPQFVGTEDGASMLLAAATVYLTVLLAGDIIWAAATGLAER